MIAHNFRCVSDGSWLRHMRAAIIFGCLVATDHYLSLTVVRVCNYSLKTNRYRGVETYVYLFRPVSFPSRPVTLGVWCGKVMRAFIRNLKSGTEYVNCIAGR